MSHVKVRSPLPSWGLGTFRWSVAAQFALSPASIAGLPGLSAWVWRLLPFCASGPSRGSTLFRSVTAVNEAAHEVSLLRLFPKEVNGEAPAWQLPPRF